MRSALWLALGLACTACGDGGDPPDAQKKDGGVSTDGGTTMVKDLRFTVEIVDGLDSAAVLGDNAAAALNAAGQPTVAYGALPPGGSTRTIRYAERRDADDWQVETVVEPGRNAPAGGDLVGLGLAQVGGQPHIVYLGGDDDMNPVIDFTTDLMLSIKSGSSWQESTLVDTSGEATGMCLDMGTYCNFGAVVGSHAAIAAQGSNYAVVYRDTHNGFAVDDLARSDVEVYRGGAMSGARLVNPERGGGAYGDIAFRPGGQLVTAYLVRAPEMSPAEGGIYVSVEGPQAYEHHQIDSSATSARVSVAVDSQDTIWVAFFDATESDLIVARSDDLGQSWQKTRVDQSGKTGLHPDLALDKDGNPIVAYTYCGPTSDRNCPAQLGAKSEVRLAYRVGNEWKTQKVADGEGQGSVGLFQQLLIMADGKAAVIYQDARNNDLLFAISDRAPGSAQ